MRHALVALLTLPLLLMPSEPFAAQATKGADPVAIAAACKGVDVKKQEDQGCSTLLAKTLNADPATLKALQTAAKANDQTAAKALLLKAGLTKQQLADAKIVFKDQTGGSNRIKDVTITITCCPLVITITIRF